MASTYLTPTQVTRESLRVLHSKLNFIKNINRDYDESFAKSGAKIGNQLKVRLPNKYTVRTGRLLAVQEVTEPSTTITVATQKGVDMNFNADDLTLSIDRFSERYIEPAMSVLASAIEADAWSMYKDIYQQANQSTITSALTFATVLAARKALVDALVPSMSLNAILSTQNNLDLVDVLKALFQSSPELKKQYEEGVMGYAAGFKFMESTIIPRHTSGTELASGSSTLTVSGANQTGAAITVTNGSSKTLKAGDIITFVGCNRVHPETKVDTGQLQQFVVTADVSSSGTSIPISPSIVTSGATQNVTASPTNSQAIKKIAGASGVYDMSMAFHKDAFTFVAADLEKPNGVDFVAREVMDNISMRIVRQYDINNDAFPTRIDVLYGYKTIRPELACRIASNSSA
jgi:hypothetical protein